MNVIDFISIYLLGISTGIFVCVALDMRRMRKNLNEYENVLNKN